MIDVLVLVLAAAALPGVVELLVLTLAGLLPARRPGPQRRSIGRLAVVVPAHDEEDGIASCVRSLLDSDPDADVVVVADNCTDRTRQRAAEAGARVLVRHDETLRGKGYALDHAFRILLDEDVDALAVVDADTQVDADFLPEVRRWLQAGEDVVQCRYTVLNPGDSVRTRLMAVALCAFNVVRPRGRARLGLSAGLFGNGFALTADVLRALPYDATSVVEDLEYHLRLVDADRRVAFADGTTVRAVMPTGDAAATTQRARWEGGRLRMAREHAPALVGRVVRGRLRALEPLLDLLLPPLALHVVLLTVLAALPSPTARVLGAGGLAVVGLHVGAALVVGRAGLRDVAALASVPFYVAWKLLRLPAIVLASRGGAAWVRTGRETGTGAS